MHEAVEFKLPLREGNVTGLRWGADGGRRLVGLHGWLDNAASFTRLGPLLAERGIQLWAFDFPGHGRSDHRSPGDLYHMLDYVVVIDRLIDALEWDQTWILGHSLGGVLALIHAAAASDRLAGLMVLDALGPISAKPEDTATNLRKLLDRQRAGRGGQRLYPDLGPLVEERMKGFGGLSREASQCLLERNLEPVEGGYRWRSDPRLRWPSLMRMTEEQVRSCLGAISLPVHLVFGRDGFFGSPEAREPRLSCMKTARVHEIDGPHHFHMDGDVNALAQLVDDWLNGRLS